MAANILILIDEVETTILALNPPTYFDELDAAKTLFHVPHGRENANMRRAQPRLSPALSTRLFTMEPGIGQTNAEHSDGTASIKHGEFEVHIQYFIPPRDANAQRHIKRMAARDGEVISHAITTRTWTNDFTGPETEFITSNGLEPIDEAQGLWLVRLLFRADYHYDGL